MMQSAGAAFVEFGVQFRLLRSMILRTSEWPLGAPFGFQAQHHVTRLNGFCR